MQKTLHVRPTVLPGGGTEMVDQELPVGESVSVVVLHSSASLQRSAVDILNEVQGQRLFKAAGDVASYLKGERAPWDR